MSDKPIWAVTGYDIGGNTGYVVEALFTNREAAEQYLRQDDCADELEIEEWTLHDEAPKPYPLYQRIAEVYPNGGWRESSREETIQFPGWPAISDSGKPFDGHLQGHCGWHVYVSGSDREAVEDQFQKRIVEAVESCDGRCPDCGRTDDFVTGFWAVGSGPLSSSAWADVAPQLRRVRGGGT